MIKRRKTGILLTGIGLILVTGLFVNESFNKQYVIHFFAAMFFIIAGVLNLIKYTYREKT
jgi:uncharacterized membrane protein HdeD (DUF308 family)